MRPEIEEGALGEQRRRELAARLERVGLEMWRNTEGAWMIRAKKKRPSRANSKHRRAL